MKKLFILFSFMLLTMTAAQAQLKGGVMLDTHAPMCHIDTTAGGQYGMGNYTHVGIGGRLFGRYEVVKRLEVGAEVGFSTHQGKAESQLTGGSLLLNGMLTADYYFSSGKFAPYAGLGYGLYDASTAALSEEDSKLKVGEYQMASRLLAARAGFSYGRFNFDVAYLLGKSYTDFNELSQKYRPVNRSRLKTNNSTLRFGVGYILGNTN